MGVSSRAQVRAPGLNSDMVVDVCDYLKEIDMQYNRLTKRFDKVKK